MNRFLLTGIISSVLFAACTPTATPPQISPAPQSTQTTPASTALDSALPAADAPPGTDTMLANESAPTARTLDIDMFSFGYSMDTITAKPGETITLNLTATDAMHNFVIDELNVKSATIKSGDNTTVTFTIPESAAGESYEYYCSVGNHRAQGMVGTLIVE
jgi:plastocyanin